jgi:hypothetical protein
MSQDFRRDLNREFDAISGSPSPALSARVRSALAQGKPARNGPFWMAGLAAGLIAAIVVGVLVVASFNRHQTSLQPSTAPTPSPSASPSPSSSASPSATASPTPVASPTSPAGPYSCTSADASYTNAPLSALINAVRTGTHSGYDQVTIQFSTSQPGEVQIVPQSNANFTESPKGQQITLAGQDGILITISGTDGHTQYTGPTDFKTNYAVLVELRQVQDFEGTVQWALGLSHGACYAYTFLTNPTRLVIYIQQ